MGTVWECRKSSWEVVAPRQKAHVAHARSKQRPHVAEFTTDQSRAQDVRTRRFSLSRHHAHALFGSPQLEGVQTDFDISINGYADLLWCRFGCTVHLPLECVLSPCLYYTRIAPPAHSPLCIYVWCCCVAPSTSYYIPL